MAYIKLTDLSPYTIASNCTDFSDLKVGIDEITAAIKNYENKHGFEDVPPKSFYVRAYKLAEKQKKMMEKNAGKKKKIK